MIFSTTSNRTFSYKYSLKPTFAQPQRKGSCPALRALPPTTANGRYLSNSARLEFRRLMAPLLLSELVVHLFEAIVAFIVTPIDEYGSVIETRAILAPTLKSHMGLGQCSYGRSMPREIALGPVGAEDHGRAAIAVTVTTGFMLSRIANIKDADGPHKIELRSADIDVRTILNEQERLVGRNEIVDWRGLERSAAVRLVKGLKDAASVA